jgi:uncharacterized FlgJ-related protein
MKKTVLIFIFLMFICASPRPHSLVANIQYVDETLESLSYSSLYKTITDMDIQFPDIVFAQAVIESGNFKSKLTKVNNNIFGMRLPKRRETTAIGESKSGYAIYCSWIDSVKDYLHWQNYFLKDREMTREEYFRLLDRVYAEDERYVTVIKKKIKEHQKLFN